MFAPSSRAALAGGRTLCSSTTIPPTFLVPAFQTSTSTPTTQPRRPFSATASRPSKLGRTPLTVPPGVEVAIGELTVKKDVTSYLKKKERTVTISGPLGQITHQIPSTITITHDPTTSQLTLAAQDESDRTQKQLWGTNWSYLRNHIMGVSEGHTTVLRLVGIGYRATVETRPELEEYPGQQFVCLKLGFSHPVDMGCPPGVRASAPQPTRVLLEGPDKEVLNSFAAKIRQWRRPEPYKGKGIFVNAETIRLKQKKIK